MKNFGNIMKNFGNIMKNLVHCFQLQNRTSLFISFLLWNFDTQVLSCQFMKFHGRLCGMSPQRKDASTFVLIFCTLFILHNILIHLFDFGNNSVKLDKSHTNQGALANHRLLMETGRRQDGQPGQRDRESARLRLTRCDGRSRSVWSVRVTSGFLFPGMGDSFQGEVEAQKSPAVGKALRCASMRDWVSSTTGAGAGDKCAGSCEELEQGAANGLFHRRSRSRGRSSRRTPWDRCRSAQET